MQYLSFCPVGKVDEIIMYPMDFEEFLWAMGEFMDDLPLYVACSFARQMTQRKMMANKETSQIH